MASLLADHLDVNTVHQLMRDVGMAQAMKGNSPYACGLHQSIKGFGETVRVPRYPAVTEDKFISADPRLLGTMGRQRLHRQGWRVIVRREPAVFGGLNTVLPRSRSSD